jgi:sugar phosphate isomerase/epimerase
LASDDPDQAEAASVWLGHWIDHAAELRVEQVTFSTGQASRGSSDPVQTEQALERLSQRLDRLIRRAEAAGTEIALRPRAGDVVSTVAQFERLAQWLERPRPLRLAADIGEMLASHELPVADRLARNREALGCVYVCDQRPGAAGDLPIGQGDVDVSRILRALDSLGYGGPVIFRVQGHSGLGFGPAREAIAVFGGAIDSGPGRPPATPT